MGLFGKSKGADPKEQVDKEQIIFGCTIIYMWLQVNEWCKKLRKEERGLERQVAHGNYDIMWESANEHKANMPGDCDQKGRSQGHSFFEGGGKERGQGCVQDSGKVWQRIRWLFEPQKV